MVKVGHGTFIHIFMLLQLLLLIAVSEGSILKRPKRHVHIMNFLDHNINLNVHCKSTDDDLGFHDVSYGNEYQFEFYPNIFGTTMFFCNLQWQGKVQLVTVYDARTSDFERCVNNCYWRVELHQICTWGDAGQKQQLCSPWK
ncbi:putative plant self-incompatibility S1 [Lupinus albus]|uniref:S-protein homolog n=1 Tax=Lupinus albus TaxID=3870 RepID=A0A6A4P811_LUPAL|nr:putative plant self-incompatibility S1 [Lupinus albus]